MAATLKHVVCFLAVTACIHVSGVASLQCLDANGNHVDWFMTYKVPHLTEPEGWMFEAGVAHMYLDLHSPSWTLSKKPINGSGHAIYNTLQQLYKSQDDSLFYVMYNDEKPEDLRRRRKRWSYSEYGHTKGVVAFGKDSGIWLIHSTPHFPPRKSDGYAFPESGERYGQSFLCISLDYDQLGTLGHQLMYNSPDIYDHNIPQSIGDDYPVLQDLVDKVKPKEPPYFKVVDLTSLGGQVFKTFAKSGALETDLYQSIVSKSLNSDLLVETWMNGSGGKVESNCSLKYKVFDVTYVSLPDDVYFKRTKDHSKWATSYSKDASLNSLSKEKTSGSYWTCVGDINRMRSQWHRGGGTTCLQNAKVWKTFRSSVDKYQPCDSS